MILLMSTLAWADVVEPEPEDCPNGAIGTTNHSGPYCTPHRCAERSCDDGVCETTGLCVVEEERPCGGMQTPGSTCTYTHSEAFGPCETDGDCSQGTCVTDEYCVDPAYMPISKCGCSSTGGASLAVLLGLLTAAGMPRTRRTTRS